VDRSTSPDTTSFYSLAERPFSESLGAAVASLPSPPPPAVAELSPKNAFCEPPPKNAGVGGVGGSSAAAAAAAEAEAEDEDEALWRALKLS